MEEFVRLSDSCKRDLHTAKTELASPQCRLTFGQKCFSHKGAKPRNHLSIKIKSSKKHEILKNHSCNARWSSGSLLHIA